MNDPESRALDGWLVSKEAAKWLAKAADATVPLHKRTERLRMHLSPQQTQRVLEMAELRRRGRAKFTAADKMFFTVLGLQQATDQWIGLYKAQRFQRLGSVADLCCGLGGDAMALSQTAERLFGCDRSARAIEFARMNVPLAARSAQEPATLLVRHIEAVNLRDFNAWHIDPDRRVAGRRSTHAELHEPSSEAIDKLLRINRHAAVKLAPACEVPSHWQESAELEWISRSGECKQLVMWQGKLAGAVGQRRATIVGAKGETFEVIHTIASEEIPPRPYGRKIERFVYEPDPAVLASDLTGVVAHRYGLWTFASTKGYLTGPKLVDDPCCAAFAVRDVLPLKVKQLGSYLRERNIGQLEIKLRSVDVTPERLRKELKLSGDNHATLIVTRIGEKRIAIVADRVDPQQTTA